VDERVIGLSLVVVLLYLLVQWQIRELGKRVKAMEDRAVGSGSSSIDLGDLRNPHPEALRQALDPARGMRDPDAFFYEPAEVKPPLTEKPPE
jgi:hypothetical protein